MSRTIPVTDAVPIPVIASGGMGQLGHLEDVVAKGHADAVAMADVLHYERITFRDIRNHALNASIPVRKI